MIRTKLFLPSLDLFAGDHIGIQRVSHIRQRRLFRIRLRRRLELTLEARATSPEESGLPANLSGQMTPSYAPLSTTSPRACCEGRSYTQWMIFAYFVRFLTSFARRSWTSFEESAPDILRYLLPIASSMETGLRSRATTPSSPWDTPLALLATPLSSPVSRQHLLSDIAQATAVLKHLWSAGEIHLHVRAHVDLVGRRVHMTSLTLRLDGTTDPDHIHAVPRPQTQQPSAGSPDVVRACRVQHPHGG